VTTTELVILIVVFLVTSAIGVVTGSNSLVAVPVMFQLGIDPKVAIATNMFGLVFMSIGGTIPFLRAGKVDIARSVPLILITLVGSSMGAFLVGMLSSPGLKLIVSISMIAVAIFTIFRRGEKAANAGPDRKALPLVYLLTGILAIYGGLFSGGYVTMLTAVYVGIWSMRYDVAVGTTKIINVFSSLIATLIFMWQGLVDYSVGAVLAVTMFIGAYAGAHLAVKLDELWLRRVFVATVILLAAKTLYDAFL
jgi:uncharacterized protein